MATTRPTAKPPKTIAAPVNSPVAKDPAMALLEGLNAGDDETQHAIDQSVTRELEGVGKVIAGVALRPLTLQMVLLLHQAGNEIMAGTKIGEMRNPLLAAAQFLFVCDVSRPVSEVRSLVFGEPGALLEAVLDWTDTLPPVESLPVEIINHVNEQAATRVKAKPPKSRAGSAEPGNGSRRRGR